MSEDLIQKIDAWQEAYKHQAGRHNQKKHGARGAAAGPAGESGSKLPADAERKYRAQISDAKGHLSDIDGKLSLKKSGEKKDWGDVTNIGYVVEKLRDTLDGQPGYNVKVPSEREVRGMDSPTAAYKARLTAFKKQAEFVTRFMDKAGDALISKGWAAPTAEISYIRDNLKDLRDFLYGED